MKNNSFNLIGILIAIGILTVIVCSGLYYSQKVFPVNNKEIIPKKINKDGEVIIKKDSKNLKKEKVCPDEWFRNEEPCSFVNSPNECSGSLREYFILNGKRRELTEFDLGWVKKNCNLKIQILH